MIVQVGDDVLLDFAGHLVEGIPAGDRHGEVDDRGAAKHADGGVRMTMLEGGALGQSGEWAVSAAAEGDADTRDHAGEQKAAQLRRKVCDDPAGEVPSVLTARGGAVDAA